MSMKSNGCSDICPVSVTADILEHKWATLIIRDLLSGKKRFSELEKSLNGVSSKVLSQRLTELEEKQLISRTLFPTKPPTTEYELTELGQEIRIVIEAMEKFGGKLMQTTNTQLGSKL